MGGLSPSHETASARLRESLRDADIKGRLPLLGIAAREDDGAFRFHAFGRAVILTIADRTLASADGAPLPPAEYILILKYLGHPLPVRPTGELISFRELPGGMFYYEPFMARAVTPLVKTVGNDVDLLRRGLAPFQWEPYAAADFAAAVSVIGPVSLYLLYWTGDGEFGPRGEYLFDRSLRGIFNADDMAVMASHVTAIIRGAIKKA